LIQKGIEKSVATSRSVIISSFGIAMVSLRNIISNNPFLWDKKLFPIRPRPLTFTFTGCSL